MKDFDEVVDRITGILRTCTYGEHSFVAHRGECTDCSAFPEVVSLDGNIGSVEKINLTIDGKVFAEGRTEHGDFGMNIEHMSYEEVADILTTMEEQLGMEVSHTFKKFSFPITSICRGDISALGYKGAETISDSVMEKIAQKMADAYVEQSFWADLDFFVSEYCNLEKENDKN